MFIRKEPHEGTLVTFWDHSVRINAKSSEASFVAIHKTYRKSRDKCLKNERNMKTLDNRMEEQLVKLELWSM